MKKILVSSLIVSFGLLLGRLMGFLREASIASTFGVSAEADIAILALTIPDVLVSMLVAGGLSAALIPEFKRLSDQEAGALFFQASLLAAVVFSVLALILGLFPHMLVGMFAPGMGEQTGLKAQGVLAGVLWLIPLTVLAGVSTAYLQAQEKFLMPALGTLIFNAAVVFGLMSFVESPKDLNLLVYFIVLGGVLRWGSQLWSLLGQVSWQHNFSTWLLHKRLFHQYWQAVLALGLLTLFPVVARSFASFSGEGSLAMMNYAWRLVEFPLGLVVTVLSVVLFPKLAAKAADKDDKGFSAVFNDGLLLSLVLAMVIVGPVLASPATFVEMVFGWGKSISDADIQMIAQLLQIGILILPVQAVIAMSMAAFNAKNKSHLPAVASASAFVLLLMLSWYVAPIYGLHGIVVVMLMGYVLVAIILLYLLWKEGIGCKRVLATYPLILGAVSYIVAKIALKLELELAGNFIVLISIVLLSALGAYPFIKKARKQYSVLEREA